MSSSVRGPLYPNPETGYNGTMLRSFFLAATLLFAPASHAQQSTVRYLFWEQVAPLTPALYCAADVAELRTTDNYSIEHVYPRSWMRQTLGCKGDACDAVPEFVLWENDLQNLMPANFDMNSARGDRAFADLEPSDDWRGQSCFRSRSMAITGTVRAEGVVEPRDQDKGDIARILLYVHDQYGGLLPAGQLEIARRWSAADPSSPEECARQAVIERLQGTRNPTCSATEPTSDPSILHISPRRPMYSPHKRTVSHLSCT